MTDPTAHERHLTVPRTARYAVLGEPGPATRELWIVCHGYGQLARYFVRDFVPLAADDRLIVAPEALSRFYLTANVGAHAGARVGATWMTREDREREIDDYVRYLDALHAHVLAGLDTGRVTVWALGFSQGAATAARWATRGHARVDRLVLWAGRVPPDLDLALERERLARLRLTLVAGDQDEYATPEAIAEQEGELRGHGVPYRLLTFAGGHAIDAATLARVAAEGDGGADDTMAGVRAAD